LTNLQYAYNMSIACQASSSSSYLFEFRVYRHVFLIKFSLSFYMLIL